MRSELEFLFAAISDELGILIRFISPGEKLASSQINDAFAAFEAKVNQMRAQGILLKAPVFARLFAESIVDRVASIEKTLSIYELAQFTPRI